MGLLSYICVVHAFQFLKLIFFMFQSLGIYMATIKIFHYSLSLHLFFKDDAFFYNIGIISFNEKLNDYLLLETITNNLIYKNLKELFNYCQLN